MKHSENEKPAEEKPTEIARRITLRVEEVAIPEVCVTDEEGDEFICVATESIEFEDVAVPEITHCAWEHKEDGDEEQ